MTKLCQKRTSLHFKLENTTLFNRQTDSSDPLPFTPTKEEECGARDKNNEMRHLEDFKDFKELEVSRCRNFEIAQFYVLSLCEIG